jgi:hypothetical protein
MKRPSDVMPANQYREVMGSPHIRSKTRIIQSENTNSAANNSK